MTTAEGSKIRLYADGRTESTPSGDVAKQLSSQALSVERQVTKEDGGTLRVDYIIVNSGLEERGIPGVRIATVEGNIIETDAYGRYHLEGIDVANIARGRNFIMKVDPATLPPRSEFTTANPLVKRSRRVCRRVSTSASGCRRRYLLKRVQRCRATVARRDSNEHASRLPNLVPTPLEGHQDHATQNAGCSHRWHPFRGLWDAASAQTPSADKQPAAIGQEAVATHFSIDLPNGGMVWATEDPTQTTPVLSVQAGSEAAVEVAASSSRSSCRSIATTPPSSSGCRSASTGPKTPTW